jgi:hypothetical protein
MYNQTNRVLERRTACNLINPYSPSNQNIGFGDGFVNPYQYTVEQNKLLWGDPYFGNKKNKIGNSVGAIFPDSNIKYTYKIKPNIDNYNPPFLYYSIWFNGDDIGKVKYNFIQPYHTTNQSGFPIWFGLELEPHNFGNYPWSKLRYDGWIFNQDSSWNNFIPKTNAEIWQFEGWVQNPPNSGQFYCRWTKISYNYIGCSTGWYNDLIWNRTVTSNILKSYNASVPRWRTGWTPDQDDPDFVKFYTSGTNPNYSLFYYKQFGSEIKLSDIPSSSFNEYISNSYNLGNEMKIYLRLSEDLSQPEFQIQNNNQNNNVSSIIFPNGWTTSPQQISNLSSYNGLMDNQSPYWYGKKSLQYNILCHKNGGCRNAYWYKNKVLKIKLKWESGTIEVIKNPGAYTSSGTNVGTKIEGKITWSGNYSEEIIDNMDIYFNGDDPNYNVYNKMDYGIIKSFWVECDYGQAKRLVDVCVLEIRDKT